jgi:aspartate kinase
MSTNSTIVLKFGGASVASPAHFSQAAEIIAGVLQEYRRVVVVVSAMGETTDHLISLVHQVDPNASKREFDMLVSVGERISISLLAVALNKQGIPAKSFTGSQSGIITCPNHADAKIIDVRPRRILQALDEGYVTIVAGFQGVSEFGEITTLGRGGSDTSAVAVAAAVGACKVQFYKDVRGIYDQDPHIHKDARLCTFLSYREAFEIVEKSGYILHPRSIALAEKNKIPLVIQSYIDSQESGTVISQQQAEEGERFPTYEINDKVVNKR